MRRLLALHFAFVFMAVVGVVHPSLDPELDQLDLELRTYAPSDDWLTPYASNGPFCCPIVQLAVSGENLLAVSSAGYWVSANGDTWNVINRLPPDMLASTGDALFISLPGTGLMEAAGGGPFSAVRSPQGKAVTDLTEIEDILYAANGSENVFSAPEEGKAWKLLPTVSRGASIRSVAVAGENLYAGAGKKGEIYRSANHGSSWTLTGALPTDSGNFKRLVSLDDEIYAVTERGLFQPTAHELWRSVVQAPPDAGLFSVVDFKGRRYAGTDRGLYVLLPDGSWDLAHAILSRGPVSRVSYAGGMLFASTKNGLFESTDSGRTWRASPEPLGRGISVNGVVSLVDGRDFAATSRGLFGRSNRSSPWTAVPISSGDAPVLSIALTKEGKILVATAAFASANEPRIYESGELGVLEFHKLPRLPYASQGVHVAAVDEEIFALPDYGAFHLSADQLEWVAEDSLAARQVSSVVARGDLGIAAMTAGNIFLKSISPSGVWAPLHVQIPRATDAWFDPKHPEVVVAISGDGLSWSSNIFEPTRSVAHWSPDRPLAFGATFSICQIPSSANQPATLVVGTDYGVYLLVDKLHREGAVERSWRAVSQIWDRYSKEPWFWIVSPLISIVAAYLLAVLAIIALAWKGFGGWLAADWLLSLIAKPMEIFPRLLRWVLFFGYRKRLLKLPDVGEVSERYFGLPCTFAGGAATQPDADGSNLHKAIATSLMTSNCVLIQGEGGAGKSTVLARLAWLALTGQLGGPLRNCLPLYISSSSYEGDFIQAVSDTLKRRDGLPLDRNGDIVRQQLQAGKMLVLFDGVSEIEGDKAKALARMVALASEKEMRESWFIFSSRPLKRIPDALPVARLEPLKLETIEKTYLPTRSDLDVERRRQVLRQLSSFGTGPIEPLLLILAINDSLNDTVATTKADLFKRYFRKILRVQAETDRLAWEGWNDILQQLADWFMLDTGRRGFGLPHRILLRLMAANGTSRGLLTRIEAEYGLTFDNELSVLEQLASIGILTSGIHWNFRHDSFEAYFAAARILAGIAEDDPVDLQIWTGPSAKDFSQVIEFVSEMGTPVLIESLLSQLPDFPTIWRAVLDQSKTAQS